MLSVPLKVTTNSGPAAVKTSLASSAISDVVRKMPSLQYVGRAKYQPRVVRAASTQSSGESPMVKMRAAFHGPDGFSSPAVTAASSSSKWQVSPFCVAHHAFSDG